MSKGIGRRIQFGVAKETVRGTPNSSASYWHPWSEHSVDEKDARVQLNQANGVIEDGIGEVITRQWAEFSLKAPVDDTILPLYLISLLGSVSDGTHSGESAVYDHTITVAQTATHQTLSLYSDDPVGGQDYKYGLGVVTSFDLNYQVGKFIEADIKLKSLKGVTASNSPSATSINRFIAAHLTFKYASAISGLSGASAVVIRSAKLSIKNNIEDDHNLGSLSPTDFVNKAFQVSGEVTLLWADETYKTLGVAGTAKALRFDLVNPNVTLGSAANPQLRIDLANAVFGQVTREVKLGDMVMQTVPFTGYYSTSDTETLSILAVNTVASY